MRTPLPKNRLVALTLVGALATAVVTVAVVSPGLLRSPLTGNDDPTRQVQGTDAPQPNEDFTPAVDHGTGGEHEEGEDEGHEDEYEEEDHEEEDHEEDE